LPSESISDEEAADKVSNSVDDSTLAMEDEETLENTNQSPKPKKQRDKRPVNPNRLLELA
jgi:hypothetical protein